MENFSLISLERFNKWSQLYDKRKDLRNTAKVECWKFTEAEIEEFFDICNISSLPSCVSLLIDNEDLTWREYKCLREMHAVFQPREDSDITNDLLDKMLDFLSNKKSWGIPLKRFNNEEELMTGVFLRKSMQDVVRKIWMRLNVGPKVKICIVGVHCAVSIARLIQCFMEHSLSAQLEFNIIEVSGIKKKWLQFLLNDFQQKSQVHFQRISFLEVENNTLKDYTVVLSFLYGSIGPLFALKFALLQCLTENKHNSLQLVLHTTRVQYEANKAMQKMSKKKTQTSFVDARQFECIIRHGYDEIHIDEEEKKEFIADKYEKSLVQIVYIAETYPPPVEASTKQRIIYTSLVNEAEIYVKKVNECVFSLKGGPFEPLEKTHNIYEHKRNGIHLMSDIFQSSVALILKENIEVVNCVTSKKPLEKNQLDILDHINRASISVVHNFLNFVTQQMTLCLQNCGININEKYFNVLIQDELELAKKTILKRQQNYKLDIVLTNLTVEISYIMYDPQEFTLGESIKYQTTTNGMASKNADISPVICDLSGVAHDPENEDDDNNTDSVMAMILQSKSKIKSLNSISKNKIVEEKKFDNKQVTLQNIIQSTTATKTQTKNADIVSSSPKAIEDKNKSNIKNSKTHSSSSSDTSSSDSSSSDSSSSKSKATDQEYKKAKSANIVSSSPKAIEDNSKKRKLIKSPLEKELTQQLAKKSQKDAPIEMQVACDTVFVGNLGVLCDADKEKLRFMFSKCGVINDLMKKPQKKFAYIKYRDNTSIHAALLLNGTSFNGRKLLVELKHKK